ncbi:hypothetical protein NL676_005453 [Syzygium grande]|nr:hypothetical protein NL676_005453 [Syzygium grande]
MGYKTSQLSSAAPRAHSRRPYIKLWRYRRSSDVGLTCNRTYCPIYTIIPCYLLLALFICVLPHSRSHFLAVALSVLAVLRPRRRASCGSSCYSPEAPSLLSFDLVEFSTWSWFSTVFSKYPSWSKSIHQTELSETSSYPCALHPFWRPHGVLRFWESAAKPSDAAQLPPLLCLDFDRRYLRSAVSKLARKRRPRWKSGLGRGWLEQYRSRASPGRDERRLGCLRRVSAVQGKTE